MAALLMPESIFTRVAAMNGGVKGGGADGKTDGGAKLIANIAMSFEVSKQAATYRLQGFGFLA